MSAALEQAKMAYDRDEVPVGAVIVEPASNTIICAASNRTRELNDPTAHAEILAIRQACDIKNAQRIPGLEMYVTLEPCAMCAAALSFARISVVYIGALDKKGGGILHGPKIFDQPTVHHKPIVNLDYINDDSSQILKDFFKQKRK